MTAAHATLLAAAVLALTAWCGWIVGQEMKLRPAAAEASLDRRRALGEAAMQHAGCVEAWRTARARFLGVPRP